jgi:hypothetical protein
MVLRTFAAPSEASRPAGLTYRETAEVAKDWQQIGSWADVAELKGSELGLPPDRFHELIGCVAAAGEQLGLAWTSEQETERWRNASGDGRAMAVRALADIRSHFSLGAAHGMANATLRTVFLSRGAAQRAVAEHKKTLKPYPPFSNVREAWPTFNKSLVDALMAGAEASNERRVIEYVSVLKALVTDSRYIALDQRRGMDYHRWRPQSLPPGSGVPQKSMWTRTQKTASFGIGGPYPTDKLADPDEVATIATNGMNAIANTMRLWLERWPEAMSVLGIGLWMSS